MCFSPEASFAAAAVLSGLGYASLKAAKTKPLILLGLIPCFFALQQFSEGIVWLNLRDVISSSFLTEMAKNTYLLIAFLWPFWIPLSLFLNEKNSIKKKFLFLFLILGMIAFLSISFYALPIQKTYPAIKGNSIQYGSLAPFYTKVIYALIILIPCFISSLRYMWAFGLFIVLSFAIAEMFYSYAFASVWCFFVAIISFSIYFIIKSNRNN